MIHVSTTNPFQARHTYDAGALNDRTSSVRKALAIARTYAGKGKWADVTPAGIEEVDGRTVATIIANGGTVAALNADGKPAEYVWDEEVTHALEEADFQEEGTALHWSTTQSAFLPVVVPRIEEE